MHSFLLLFVCYIWTGTFYSSIGSGILRFARSNLGITCFVEFSNQRNKGVQGSKHRSVISMLNKIFGKHVTVFKDLIDTTEKFIKLFLLPWIRTMQLCVGLLHDLLLFFAFLLVYLLVCLFIYLCCLFIYFVYLVPGSVTWNSFSLFALIYVAMGWYFVLSFTKI